MKHYLITLFFSLLGINLQAQIEASRDVFGSSGNEFSNTTLQMSFTVGESFTLSLQNDGIHTQGFQQSDRWFTTVSQLHESQFQLFPIQLAMRSPFKQIQINLLNTKFKTLLEELFQAETVFTQDLRYT